MCINKGVNIVSFLYYIEYMFHLLKHSIPLETKVPTLVIWLFWKFIEGIRLNFVLVSTKSIWALVNMIAMHFYKILC